MTITKFSDRLNKLGLLTNVNGDDLELKIDSEGSAITVRFDEKLKKSINSFYRARQYSFEELRRLLKGRRFVEFQVSKLAPAFIYRPYYAFSCASGDAVTLSNASDEFHLSFFESDRYEEIFDLIKKRIERKIERGESSRSRRIMPMRGGEFFLNIYTARYSPKRITSGMDLTEIGLKKIKACLFSLAYTYHESWEVRDEIKSRGFSYPRLHDEEVNLEIPSAEYESSLVSYYKVAKSSSFPGQCFLSYYHILEFHFLRVADENLFNAVKAKLNDPAFKSTYENVSKLLATIKRNDSVGDEKEMLKSVLRKYVVEEEFIEFVKDLESEEGEKIYTGNRQRILGEEFNLKLDNGHALSNFSQVLKHIRNCLVHSSDRYSRGDTFLPLAESEDLIVKYIPIVQYMAERIIFSTAE